MTTPIIIIRKPEPSAKMLARADAETKRLTDQGINPKLAREKAINRTFPMPDIYADKPR